MDKDAILSEEEIHQMEVAIYNDDTETLLSLLPDTVGENSFQEQIKELIGEAEWTYVLPASEYIISSKGDVFHSRHKRLIKLQYSPVKMALGIRGKYYNIKDIFEREGWEYNHKEVTDYLYKNGRLFIPRLYKHLFSE